MTVVAAESGAGLISLVLEGLHDMGNYTKWFPEEHRHQMKDMPPISMWDLHYGLYCAVAITIVRYYLVNPFYTWLAVQTLHLAPHSLVNTNKMRLANNDSDYIPPFVFPILASFLEWQDAAKLKAKKSKKPEAVVAAKREADKKWTVVEKSLLLQLQRNEPSVKYSSSDIRRWLSAIQADNKRTAKLKKFNEAGWTFSFYLFIWVFGLICLSDKDYFTESVHLVWKNYPLDAPSADICWYYWLSVGHYVHLFVSQFFDIKRKDFVEMLIHHCVTLLLLSFSWMVNFSKIGALVLAVHDGCDVFLQAAKLLNYMHKASAANVMFVAFALCFFVCRLIIYPFRIIYSSMIWTRTVGGYKPWFVYYFFNALLCSLLVLHLIWFSIIANMAWTFVTSGEIKKDARSDTDADGSASETEGGAANNNAPTPSGGNSGNGRGSAASKPKSVKSH